MSLPAYTPLHEYLDGLRPAEARYKAREVFQPAADDRRAVLRHALMRPSEEPIWSHVGDVLRAYAAGPMLRVDCLLCPRCDQVVALDEEATCGVPSRRAARCLGCNWRVYAVPPPAEERSCQGRCLAVVPALKLSDVYGDMPWEGVVKRQRLRAAFEAAVGVLKRIRVPNRPSLSIATPTKRHGECDCGAVGTRDSRGECRECGQGGEA